MTELAALLVEKVGIELLWSQLSRMSHVNLGTRRGLCCTIRIGKCFIDGNLNEFWVHNPNIRSRKKSIAGSHSALALLEHLASL